MKSSGVLRVMSCFLKGSRVFPDTEKQLDITVIIPKSIMDLSAGNSVVFMSKL